VRASRRVANHVVSVRGAAAAGAATAGAAAAGAAARVGALVLGLARRLGCCGIGLRALLVLFDQQPNDAANGAVVWMHRELVQRPVEGHYFTLQRSAFGGVGLHALGSAHRSRGCEDGPRERNGRGDSQTDVAAFLRVGLPCSQTPSPPRASTRVASAGPRGYAPSSIFDTHSSGHFLVRAAQAHELWCAPKVTSYVGGP
jgi:hypothetical protein